MNMKKMLLGALGMAMATSAMGATVPVMGTATTDVTGTVTVSTTPSNEISLEMKNGGFNFGAINLQVGDEHIETRAGAIVKQGANTLTEGYYFKLADAETVNWGLDNVLTNKEWWAEAGQGNTSFAEVIVDNDGNKMIGHGGATLTDNQGELSMELKVYNTLAEGSYGIKGEVWVALPEAFTTAN